MKKLLPIQIKAILLFFRMLMAASFINQPPKPFPFERILNINSICFICQAQFFRISSTISGNFANVVFFDINNFFYAVHEECVLIEKFKIENIFKVENYYQTESFFRKNNDVIITNEIGKRRKSILNNIRSNWDQCYFNEREITVETCKITNLTCLNLLNIAEIFLLNVEIPDCVDPLNFLDNRIMRDDLLDALENYTNFHSFYFAQLIYICYLKKNTLFRFYKKLLKFFDYIENKESLLEIFKYISEYSRQVSLEILKDFLQRLPSKIDFIKNARKKRYLLSKNEFIINACKKISFLYRRSNFNDITVKSMIYKASFLVNTENQLTIFAFNAIKEDNILYFLEISYKEDCYSHFENALYTLHTYGDVRTESIIFYMIFKHGIRSIEFMRFLKDDLKLEFIKIFFNITDFDDHQNISKIYSVVKFLDFKYRMLILNMMWSTPFFKKNIDLYILYHSAICVLLQDGKDYYPYNLFFEDLNLNQKYKQFQESLIMLYSSVNEITYLNGYVSMAMSLCEEEREEWDIVSIFPFFLRYFSFFHHECFIKLEISSIIIRKILNNDVFLRYLNENLFLIYFMYCFKKYRSFNHFLEIILPNSDFPFISKLHQFFLILIRMHDKVDEFLLDNNYTRFLNSMIKLKNHIFTDPFGNSTEPEMQYYETKNLEPSHQMLLKYKKYYHIFF